jgi:folate-dependent phosphoribosylglycinamide formyltransferase PurN
MERQLYEPRSWRKMHVATYASGTCLNIQNILEFQMAIADSGKIWDIRKNMQLRGTPFLFTEIFSDRQTRRAPNLAERYGIRHSFIPDPPRHAAWTAEGNSENVEYLDRMLDTERWRYDRHMARILSRRPIDFFFFGGTGANISPPFIRSFPNRILAVNLGDLSARDFNGHYKYFGQRSVLKTIMTGRTEVRISVFFLKQKHQPGDIIEISDPLPLENLDEIADFPFDTYRNMNAEELEDAAMELQRNRTKHGDFFRIVYQNVERVIRLRAHFVLARCLLDLSLGRYYQNKWGKVYKKG